MIIVNERAEERLIQNLKLMKTSGGEARCVHINGQSGRVVQKTDVPAAVSRHISSADAQLFICGDGDVFITGSGIPVKECALLREELLRALATAPPAAEKNLLEIFDVRVHWLQIMGLLESKLEQIRLRNKFEREKAEQAQKEAARGQILGMDFNDAVISSIPQRRRARENKSSLVVDDDFFTRTLVSNVVGREMASVSAGSGEEAIRSYVTSAPDIVFLDIGLPDISGHEVLTKLLKLDPQAYIVMLSGGGNRENIMQAMAAGAKGFIVKPFTQEKIRQYIDKCSAPT